MKKVPIFIVLALVLTSCFDEKAKIDYYIFSKSSHSEKPIVIKYEMDNIKKKRYEIQNLSSGISFLEVRDYVFHRKHNVYDCEISLLNETGETLQLYAMWGMREFSIDGRFVDLKTVWLYAERGEVIEGLISVDSVFNYLKNTNNKGYFEIPSNSKGEYFTFQMSEL